MTATESSEDALQALTVESSGGVELAGTLARADAGDRRGVNAVLILHGFPNGDVRANVVGIDMPELCRRIKDNLGWHAMTIRFRGCGRSTGEFSLGSWVDDAVAAVRYLQKATNPRNLWVVGFGTGGSVGLVAAADLPNVAGAAVLGSPADFDDWAADPGRLLQHSREVGVIKSPDFPGDRAVWESELRDVRAVEAAERFPPRPLLVLHGYDDEAVPQFDARMLADAHGGADLRFIRGGSHHLRHDPRAMAILIGWLGRKAMEDPV
jgi:putative redox protein